MVTVNDEENTWAQVDLQKSSVDEETETCVGDEVDGPDIPPTNYLHISRDEGMRDAPVNGQYILDLSLAPPPLPPGIAPDAVRKNLTLHTTNGHVTAEIWIKHDRSTKSKRVSLDMYSRNGAVRAIVVRHTLNSSFVPLFLKRVRTVGDNL
ncbi:hypothetical protein DFH94DRAFT_760339 [Russula ochroleuca]|uniref:DUF7330 domain-containing protein n=1 Tax=Russula ochroleuca TaxID=152965 RepID=A0A9P5K0I1_9AGAM|nr:hypothetical protein DFH94DRAFT_760339 [Russula ochroleuca]